MRWWCFVVFVIIVRGVVAEEDTESLFREPRDRETTFYKCSEKAEGIKLRLPKAPNCTIPQNVTSSSNVLVTTYWPDASIATIEARECWIEEQTLSSKKDFWGNLQNSVGDVSNPYISAQECRHIYETERTYRGVELPLLRTGLRGTSDYSRPDPSWWDISPTEVRNRNYFIATVMMTVSNRDYTVQPVGATPKSSCQTVAGMCETNRGVLIWAKEEHKKCRVKVSKETKCVRTLDRISCQETSMALIGFHKVEICGESVVQSDQGVLFTSAMDNELLNGVGSTFDVVKRINAINLPRRSKRSVLDPNVGLVTTREFKATLQHAVSTITDATNYELKNLHYTICQNNKMIINMANHQFSLGDATLVVKTLTGDDSLKGTGSGDVINVWDCEKINRWFLRPRTNCTLEWPITYFSGDKRYTGYLRPNSHEIVPVPTEVDCPAPRFYLEMDKGKLVDLDNRTVITTMDYLPNAGDGGSAGQIAEISIAPGGMYYADEITGREVLTNMMQSMSSYNVLERGVARIQRGQTPKPKEKAALDTIFDFTTQGLFGYVYILCIVISILAVAVIAIAVAIYWKPITTAVNGVWNVFVGMFRCFSFLAGRHIPRDADVEANVTKPSGFVDSKVKQERVYQMTMEKEATRGCARGRKWTPRLPRRNDAQLPAEIADSRIYPDVPTAPSEVIVYQEVVAGMQF